MMKKIPIHRTRINKEIVAEFALPANAGIRKKARVAVLAIGAPAMPNKTVFMQFLARKGFYVINPRYRGTWESSGVFLRKDPVEDIKDTIQALKRPLLSLYERKKY